PGSSTWVIASDERLKKDVTPFKDGIKILKKINPIKFHYNGKAEMPTDKEFIGVIAQDVQKTAPYMVGTFHYKNDDGNMEDYLDYDANALTYILVNSVKEQQKTIEEKDSRIESLEGKVK